MKKNKIYRNLNEKSKGLYDAISMTVEICNPNDILEIGTGWGVSAVAFLHGNNAKLITVDKISDLPEFEMRTSKAGVRDRIERIISESSSAMKLFREKNSRFDVVFIDGSHKYEDVKRDIGNALPLLKRGGIMMLDDVWHDHNFDGSYGVNMALKEFAMESGLSVTINPLGNGVAVIII